MGWECGRILEFRSGWEDFKVRMIFKVGNG